MFPAIFLSVIVNSSLLLLLYIPFVFALSMKFVWNLWNGCGCRAVVVICRPRLVSLTILLTMNFHSLYTLASSISFYWRRRHERRIFRRTYNIYEDLKLHILYGSHCRIQAEFRFKSHNPAECWNKRVYITSHQAVNIQAP